MYDLIVDLDGTIADCGHRVHYVKEGDYASSNALIQHDTPYFDILYIISTLKKAGCRVILCTARSEDCRAETEAWLKEWNVEYEYLYMRPLGDERDDADLKAIMHQQMGLDGFHPTIVFEDRDRVVKMWRDLGLTVLQVREGNF